MRGGTNESMVRYATLPLLYGESSWAELSYMHVDFFFSMLFSARMLPISMSLSSASIAIVIFFLVFYLLHWLLQCPFPLYMV